MLADAETAQVPNPPVLQLVPLKGIANTLESGLIQGRASASPIRAPPPPAATAQPQPPSHSNANIGAAMTASSPPTAVIIGAGPGVGAALARALAAGGLPLVLLARYEAHLEALAAQLRLTGAAVRTRVADAADAHQVSAAIAELRTAPPHGAPIGLLAYNAAFADGRLTEVDTATLRRSIEVNALSAIAAVQAALPDLRATRGVVLLTGGGLALHPNADAGVLSLGKAALRAAALILAEELEPQGIRVRTLTIAGTVTPGTAFDPDRIAARFLTLPDQPNVETVYGGEHPAA